MPPKLKNSAYDAKHFKFTYYLINRVVISITALITAGLLGEELDQNELPWYHVPWHKYYYMSKQDPKIIKEVIESFKMGKTISQMVNHLNMWPNSIKTILVNAGLYPKSENRKRVAWNKGIPSLKKKNGIFIIESGEYRVYTSDCTIRKRMREYRVLKFGHKCELCNNTHWQGNLIPLVCDHIDGNADNIEPENFRNICCNCDALLPTYKGRNKGNGRTFRKKNGGFTRI